MSLKTYGHDITPIRTWPLFHLRDDGMVDKETVGFKPGDWATHVYGGGTGKGIVVGVNDDEIAVLWSQEPEIPDLSRFAFPTILRAQQRLIAQEIFKIQPMIAPTGNIFYMDYAYGSGPASEPEDTQVDPEPKVGPTVGP